MLFMIPQTAPQRDAPPNAAVRDGRSQESQDARMPTQPHHVNDGTAARVRSQDARMPAQSYPRSRRFCRIPGAGKSTLGTRRAVLSEFCAVLQALKYNLSSLELPDQAFRNLLFALSQNPHLKPPRTPDSWQIIGPKSAKPHRTTPFATNCTTKLETAARSRRRNPTPLQQLRHNATQTIAPPRVCPYHH